ncbi:hypothetical protein GQ53DRAFT_844873 [Thozetella sp. PMI_491]|nr:hypothetical protein GQ53DRAFT_844873 [Thozetella sp. PMI_491]
MDRAHQSHSSAAAMGSSATPSTAEHACHCGRRFQRKEHLRRHEAVHKNPAFVCDICQRSFSRNDLLRRHVARHEAAANPATRRRQACDACRVSKTRCDGDGGASCTSCAQRAVECTYRGQRLADRDDDSSLPASQPRNEDRTESLEEVPDDGPSNSAEPLDEVADVTSAIEGPQDDEPSIGIAGASFLLESILKSENIFKDSLGERPDHAEAWCAACSKAYWGQVHDHWSLLHPPTFSLDSDPVVVTAPMLILGCWFDGPQESSELIVDTHTRLVDILFEELSKSDADLGGDRPWRNEVYEAVLFSTVFAFYSGKEQLIARAGLLLSLLIATLRQVGLFSSERADYQERTHFPGTFLPFVLSHLFFLLKIDTYLFLVNGQCPRLQPEELDVSLVSTFAIWNAFPLDELYKRLPQEPFSRIEKTMSQLSQDSELLDRSEMLIEDVQFGLFSMASALWRFTLTGRGGGAFTAGPKGLLVRRLDSWGYQLEKISSLLKAQETLTGPAEFPIRAYIGQENDLSPPVLTRIQRLLHETCVLQSIVSASLYADTHALGSFVRSQTDTSAGGQTPGASSMQDAGVRRWANSLDAKKAVLTSLAVLKIRESFSIEKDRIGRLVKPLADAALLNSAVVLRAWGAALEGSCHCGKTSGRTTDVADAVSDIPVLVADAPSVCPCRAEEWLNRLAATHSS